MENKNLIFILILIGVSIATYLPRALPIIFLSKKELPAWLTEWMKFLPAGIFAALIFPDIFTSGGSLSISFTNLKLISSFFVLIIAIKKKSLALCIFTGVTSIYLLSIILK
ncbi:MAG: AzlD domain-containing protein [Clostridium sp.]